MDFDSFLSSPRWEILRILAKSPSSPVELAKRLNTTVSYISQQLALLDAAGILHKKKTGASQRGKPRSLFGLSKEFAYISVLINGFSEKKLINLNPEKKAILKIWVSCPDLLHESAQKLYFMAKEELENYGIYYDSLSQKFFLVYGSKKIADRFFSELKKLQLNLEILNEQQFSKHKTSDLLEIISNLTLMKGGETNKNE